MVPLLSRLGSRYAEVGDDVAVDVSTLLDLIEKHDLFSGFDEIWLCPRDPESAKPSDVRLTSDVSLGPDPPPGLAEWMRSAGCFAGLGDGDGLNFATFSPDLAPCGEPS